ncbi:helix-turn-helix domain-containing protein [Mucilaginibacter sp. X4EP1]|uniref:helix-turn-helix domain-containing protein n=1 Tax=Mucilaginibacter sp. X4EP1 TaxID=2723092 RepID=UPI0021677B92|nr:helix-turn-helix transcriptional regulator [Mucilaginibacter sp. X4EP1]MCS3812936.1 transcriptional regulator with XRE-family HTH domain [Mucilaginibacter sp. X4EP1]
MKQDIFLIEMGQKIRTARKAKKMPINIMADLTKIDMSNLSFLERGMRNCHILSLKSIADVLDMDVKDFL